MFFLVFVLGLGVEVCGEPEKVFRVSAGEDSYLAAYKASRGDDPNAILDDAVKKTDREYKELPPSGWSSYGPPPSGPSGPDYGPPSLQYGPPNYPPVYGPPHPPPPPVYGPPASNVQVFYGVPHALGSIWDKLHEKLKFKLNLFTLGKILLKLVIFKKIVSFIAILCLLLFIPTLKDKSKPSQSSSSSMDEMEIEEDEDDMMRGFTGKKSDDKLNKITSFVWQAVDRWENKERASDSDCGVYCEVQRMLQKVDKNVSYKRLAKLYSKELQR
ncbi:unnamed protein product [Acanthoscelides obtectus]|uniref:Uncharacterized protein n=1 Tax=Acanthoscelides obtectus TaxID=200917 RepID=A0A9P0M8A5_ACAOB|nr:unnamed protein product [Acanthoscelides obtectus]CAK1664110.1 hypothetical protein AOBTE_LOCUS24059 [Acanthoscelides obtectus]